MLVMLLLSLFLNSVSSFGIAKGLSVGFKKLIKSDNYVGNYNCIINPTLKIPVWPVYGGVVAQFSDWLGGSNSLTGVILDKVGGRVVPMTLSDQKLSPFLLLAHHCHSFIPNDPMRTITNLIQPEGFPAHPHSGFSTVTYCIEGGLNHRDSEGQAMSYGDGDVQVYYTICLLCLCFLQCMCISLHPILH